MPYSNLPDAANKIFEKVYNDSIGRGKSKEYAAKVAWTAVKNAGYKRSESGEWVKGRSEISEFSMSIVKCSFDKENSTMRWRSVNSDTDPDLFDEAMSPELFKDFVDRIESKSKVPEPFAPLVCEDDWCGGVPYLSIAHYKSGSDKRNVPGDVESVYIDGKMLKSTGTLHNNSLGVAVFAALNRDLYKKKSDGTPEVPLDRRVRISIGFLDLEHKHILDDGAEKVFSRNNVGEICQLCATGIGRKIYTKGQLVHLALTRVPVNPRTLMEVDKSMDVMTKKDDAKSIVGELADELEEKSLANDILVVKAEGQTLDFPDELMDRCYDPTTDSFDQECIDDLMMGHMPAVRNAMAKNTEVKSSADTVSKAVTKGESWGDESASSYLVVGDREHPTSWHLPVKKHGKLDRGLAGAAKAALTSNHRGKGYAGPNKAKALAKLHSIYNTQGWDWEEKSMTEESMAEANEVKGKKKVKPEEVDTFDDEGRVNDEGEAYGQGKSKAKPMKDEESEEEDKKEGGEGSEEKKSLMAQMSKVADKVLELKSAGVSGKDAEAELQPLLNGLGMEIEKSLRPSESTTDALMEVAKALRENTEVIAQLQRENAVLKAQAGKSVPNSPKSAFVPAPRSLKVEKSAPDQPTRQLSQIERIARRSTGLQD